VFVDLVQDAATHRNSSTNCNSKAAAASSGCARNFRGRCSAARVAPHSGVGREMHAQRSVEAFRLCFSVQQHVRGLSLRDLEQISTIKAHSGIPRGTNQNTEQRRWQALADAYSKLVWPYSRRSSQTTAYGNIHGSLIQEDDKLRTRRIQRIVAQRHRPCSIISSIGSQRSRRLPTAAPPTPYTGVGGAGHAQQQQLIRTRNFRLSAQPQPRNTPVQHAHPYIEQTVQTQSSLNRDLTGSPRRQASRSSGTREAAGGAAASMFLPTGSIMQHTHTGASALVVVPASMVQQRTSMAAPPYLLPAAPASTSGTWAMVGGTTASTHEAGSMHNTTGSDELSGAL